MVETVIDKNFNSICEALVLHKQNPATTKVILRKSNLPDLEIGSCKQIKKEDVIEYLWVREKNALLNELILIQPLDEIIYITGI
jgi:hypothetical protein